MPNNRFWSVWAAGDFKYSDIVSLCFTVVSIPRNGACCMLIDYRLGAGGSATNYIIYLASTCSFARVSLVSCVSWLIYRTCHYHESGWKLEIPCHCRATVAVSWTSIAPFPQEDDCSTHPDDEMHDLIVDIEDLPMVNFHYSKTCLWKQKWMITCLWLSSTVRLHYMYIYNI